MINKVKYNDNNDELWCIDCKKRINLGEKYVEIVESYSGEKIKKTYHLECVPIDEAEEDDE